MKPLYKVEYRLPEGAVTQVTVPARDEAEAQRRAHRVARRRYPLVHVSLVRCWRFSPDASRFGGAMDRVRKVLGMVAVLSFVVPPLGGISAAAAGAGVQAKVLHHTQDAGSAVEDSRDVWAFLSWLIETEALWIAAWVIVGLASLWCLVMALCGQSDVRVTLPVPDWADEVDEGQGAGSRGPDALIPPRSMRDETAVHGAGALTAERRERILMTLVRMWGPQSMPHTEDNLGYSFNLTPQQVVAWLDWADNLIITTRAGQWAAVVEKGVRVRWVRFVKVIRTSSADSLPWLRPWREGEPGNAITELGVRIERLHGEPITSYLRKEEARS